jgi:Mg-chelatase subunit ChlD
VVAGGAAALAGVVVLVALTAAGAPETEAADECAGQGRRLDVVASPDIAPAVSAVVRSMSADTCDRVVVRAERPRATARALAAEPAARPDVWIPDSSVWTYPLLSRGARVAAHGPSVATSPFVLAVPEAAARFEAGRRPLTTARLLHDAPALRWALPDPARSSSGAAAVISLRAALVAEPAGAGRLAEMVRAGAGRAPDLAELAGNPVRTALPVTEQRVLSERSSTARGLAIAYSPARYAADYPFLVLATDRGVRSAAADLLAGLRGDDGRGLLAARGFRDPRGVLAARPASRAGVDRGTRPPRVPTAVEVETAVRTVAVIRRPSRVLAVVDVSGSMAQVVDGAGGSRLSLALRGLLTGLAAYPDDTVTGLWTFSTRLTPTTDYRRLVPLVRLGVGRDGTVGRSRLAEALTRVQVRVNGGTALYDTTLAAVSAVRRGWDPSRANAVVVVTDGANQDPHGLSLPVLLQQLRDGARDRRVPVYGVAIGPDADRRSLDAIARATGGRAYTVLDPREVVPAIQDAVGNRS